MRNHARVEKIIFIFAVEKLLYRGERFKPNSLSEYTLIIITN